MGCRRAPRGWTASTEQLKGAPHTEKGMSQENVEIARRAFEFVRQGEYGGAAGCFREDVEWHNTPAFPGPRTIVGPRAIVDFWQELFGSFGDEGERATIEKVRADGDCVVMAVRSWGQGKTSGVPVDVRWAIAFRLRDGKIQRVDVRGDYAKALEAAGLSE
jgi:ketosteroid isomerase-like protein